MFGCAAPFEPFPTVTSTREQIIRATFRFSALGRLRRTVLLLPHLKEAVDRVRGIGVIRHRGRSQLEGAGRKRRWAAPVVSDAGVGMSLGLPGSAGQQVLEIARVDCGLERMKPDPCCGRASASARAGQASIIPRPPIDGRRVSTVTCADDCSSGFNYKITLTITECRVSRSCEARRLWTALRHGRKRGPVRLAEGGRVVGQMRSVADRAGGSRRGKVGRRPKRGRPLPTAWSADSRSSSFRCPRHSSGVTTSVIGALKRGLKPLSGELGLHVCGGRGFHSRQTPHELVAIGERVGFDGAALANVWGREAGRLKMSAVVCMAASEPPPETRRRAIWILLLAWMRSASSRSA